MRTEMEMEKEKEKEKEKKNCEGDAEDSRSRRIIMTHFKDSLFSQLNHHPYLSTVDSSVIERSLRELFPAFHTPTHPPYALMIESAIMGLNEETGSTEEAISEFIKREYNNSDDLPWAHDRILGLQLQRLCQVGEIACSAEGCGSGRYVLTRDSVNEETTETKQQDEKGVISLGVTRPRVLKVYARKKNQRRECVGRASTIHNA